jgi:nitrite reductase (NO-forming)
MNPGRALSLLLILLALAVGGCHPRPPAPPAVDAEFTLKTALLEGSMAFVGVGGRIHGIANPDLIVRSGDTVRIVIVNGDGVPHDFAIPALGAQTALVTTKGQTTDVTFEASEIGEFEYYCAVSGHRQMGMTGKLIVREP